MTSLIVRHHKLSILKFIFNFLTQKLLAVSITSLPFWTKWRIVKSNMAIVCVIIRAIYTNFTIQNGLSICGIYGIKRVDDFAVYEIFDRNVISAIISL